MNFVADESVEQVIIEQLRRDGHSVLAVCEMAPSISDDQVLSIANAEESLLLTADKDLGVLVLQS